MTLWISERDDRTDAGTKTEKTPQPLVAFARGLIKTNAAAAAAVIAGLMLLRGSPLWWVACAVAAAISQAVVLTAWTDAKVGTVINMLLLGAAGYGYASQGPRSYRAEYHRHAHSALLPSWGLDVAEADLAALPDLIADYIRQYGAIGLPRVQQFQVHFHGRIRIGGSQPWIRFTSEQFAPIPRHPAVSSSWMPRCPDFPSTSCTCTQIGRRPCVSRPAPCSR